MPAPVPSSSAIPSGAPITARPTAWSGKRRKRRGGAGLTAIVCIGETQHQRDAGQTLDICGGQLKVSLPDGARADNLVVAYEPIWAIGTGLTPTAGDVEQIHRFIRELLIGRFNAEGARMRILYGGSVKPSNAGELMAVANVNGALVGGASLKASRFPCDCARVSLTSGKRYPRG